ncbi:PAS domain-containing protein [Pedobacter metabolipauper]|uniref:histidine kinase n=1 Tax=Pedobacter metabolipauper TaxID=425513 RepID=A0A4R6T140_9SPHI|nr:PAS domain-containing protein [Pedobacter metabolipauper]TDQ11308.1 PAS domain S-box-containing protein [Pedobacter metabolipauper]
MRNKTFLKTIVFYILIGGTWLLLGDKLITWFDQKYPLTDLGGLYYIKNLIFLIATALVALFILNNHYKSLLKAERVLQNNLAAHETEINQQLALYETVTKATNDVIWEYNILNDQLKWMSGYKEVFGYDDELIVYNSFWNMSKIHPDDQERVVNAFKNLLEHKEQRWNAKYQYRCADDTYKYVSDRGYVIFDQSGKPVKMIGAIQDIDIQVRYEKKLLIQNKQLKEIAWLNSHEIRRPLSNVMGLIPLLKSALSDDDDPVELVDMLETSAKDLDEAVIKVNNQTI